MRRDLIGTLAKMRRAGQTYASDLRVTVHALTPVSEPLEAGGVPGWWVRLLHRAYPLEPRANATSCGHLRRYNCVGSCAAF